jgi:hypothetical protein
VTLQSVLGCQVCSALEKQSVPRSKVYFGAKCASAYFSVYITTSEPTNIGLISSNKVQ